MADHTPTPWEVGGPYPSVTIIRMVNPGSGFPDPSPPEYECVCWLDQRTEGERNPEVVALAERICVAVNAHDALVAALKLRQDRGHGIACKHVRADHRGGRHRLVPCDCGYEEAVAALALAGK